VTVLCPVLSEEDVDYEPDPVCGIVITGKETNPEFEVVEMKGVTVLGVEKKNAKLKKYLGDLDVTIYLDCTSKKKLLSLARQFDNNYGDSFKILLDGGLVTVNLDNTLSVLDSATGINPRQAYFYKISPQPITVSIEKEIDTITLNIQSMEAT
jgi:hypothetical protein